MKKYIHYCWFGGKPLPKLARKCLESWKKYLPDYEIICWNETNVDLEECPFIKEAYEKKKWAFVADFARTKAMYEYGGIYFDTDMEITKNIDELLKNNTSFLGVEDSHLIACGVWYEKEAKSYLATKMLDFYKKQKFFDIDNIYKISIPRIISNILTDYDSSNFETQLLKHDIRIYSRDYFYPLSYDHQYNKFTDNTCMIHYYDASWTPKWEQRENRIFRIAGKKNGERIINAIRKSKRATKKVVKVGLYPAIKIKKRKNLVTKTYLKNTAETISKIKPNDKCNYIVFHNPDWFGVTNATIELFENTVPCREIYRKSDLKKIVKTIKKCGYKQVIFSGFCIGWKDLAMLLYDEEIITKVYFHGSFSQVLESYGWERHREIIKLSQEGIITTLGSCKESLINYYKKFGCNARLLTNKVNVKKYEKTKKNDKFVIGVYAAKTEDFRKNAFTALAAASLVNKKNVVVDMVPLTNSAISFAEMLDLKIDGVSKSIPREEILKRMSNCDVVIYVTFSECAPMIPLEAFAQDVPCIVGNNCHYFKNEELEKYIVVNHENNPKDIAEKIEYTIKNKNKVLKLYQDWSRRNTERTDKLLEEFLKDGDIK